MQVKDLIAQLQQLNPELEIVGYESDMERSGIMPISIRPRVCKFREEERHTRDAFDGTPYTYTVLREDENGSKEAVRLY